MREDDERAHARKHIFSGWVVLGKGEMGVAVSTRVQCRYVHLVRRGIAVVMVLKIRNLDPGQTMARRHGEVRVEFMT